MVFCVVTPCNDDVGYQHFGGPFQLHNPEGHNMKSSLLPHTTDF
jgi:hypothetical protein